MDLAVHLHFYLQINWTFPAFFEETDTGWWSGCCWSGASLRGWDTGSHSLQVSLDADVCCCSSTLRNCPCAAPAGHQELVVNQIEWTAVTWAASWAPVCLRPTVNYLAVCRSARLRGSARKQKRADSSAPPVCLRLTTRPMRADPRW